MRGDLAGGMREERCGRWGSKGAAGLAAIALAIVFACQMRAQSAPSPASGAQQPAQIAPPGTETPPEKSDAQHAPLTKAQANELFKSVDDILAFVSKDTDLPIKSSVKRKLLTRDEVNRYLKEKFEEDKGTKRLERSEVVLKKFGLLDRDFQLGPFMISLLTEQVAGFYDNKTKTVNLLDWIDPDEQKPVLAHELTHALQDQKVGLTKWSEVGPDDIAKNVQEDNLHIQTDEGDTARDAVTEGQAMVVFMDYSLRPTGKTLADSPEMMDRLKDSVADTSGSPVLARAPLLLQKSLLFPYSEGLGFEDAVLVKQGKDAAFAGVLASPPSSTMEILHPEAYMEHAPVPVLRLPDIHPLIDAEWTPYDVGVMGEYDVDILTELFGGTQIATALTPEWNGGIYYAAQKKSAVSDAAKKSTASIGLLYYSKWKNEDSAHAFLRVYAEQLPRKYSGLVRRSKDEENGDEQVYSTSEGDVLLSLSGTGVFVSEGFPLELARKLRDRIESVQSDAPLQVARADAAARTAWAGVKARTSADGCGLFDPGLSLVRVMSSAGVMKAAIDTENAAARSASGRYTLVQQ